MSLCACEPPILPRMRKLLLACLITTACTTTNYDVVIRNGMVYDGSGGAPVRGDVAIKGDRISAIGPSLRGRTEIDAGGMAVAPGFINMLSWATESLIEDGRAMADVKQGVTLEVFGEGWSMGPLNDAMKAEVKKQQGDIKYDITWT